MLLIGGVLLLIFLQDLSLKVDRKIQQLPFKFTLVDEELYHQIVDDFLLKCLDSDQAKVAMGEVHEGICGTVGAHKTLISCANMLSKCIK
jgi:hypothetical protein